MVNESAAFVNDRLELSTNDRSELASFHMGDNLSYRQHLMKWNQIHGVNGTNSPSNTTNLEQRITNWWNDRRPPVYSLCVYPYMIRELESVCLLRSFFSLSFKFNPILKPIFQLIFGLFCM